MSVKIFYDIIAPRPRALMMFIKANKIPFIPCETALRRMEQKSEEYAAINPFKQLPAMQDGDFILTESITITKYLHEKFGCPEHWYPKDLQKRSKVDEFLDWQQTDAMANLTRIYLTDVIDARMSGIPSDPDALVPAVTKMEESVDGMESYFLKDQPFLCGGDVTIADMFGVNAVIQLVASNYNPLEKRPRLKSWVERVRQRIEPEVFDDVCKIIYRLRDTKPKT